MRTSTTANIGAELLRRSSAETKVADTTSQPQGDTRKDAERSGEVHRRCRDRHNEKNGPCHKRFRHNERTHSGIRGGELGAPKRAGLEFHGRAGRRDSASSRDRTQDGGARPLADSADGGKPPKISKEEERERAPNETTRRVEPGVPNTPATKRGQEAATE